MTGGSRGELLVLPKPGLRVLVAASRSNKALMACPGAGLVYGQCRQDDWHPDLDWLEQELQGPDPPKMVTIVNPCNPTGDFQGL